MRTRQWASLGVASASLLAAMSLAGCGGGGGGSGASTPTPPTSPVTPSPPPAPTYPTSSSSEFQRSYGLGAIHADAAYQQGATGAGITVAVVDSGVNHTQADLATNVSALSTDVYASRNAPDGEDNHGTLVAGVIAAAYNGFGTVGVAYKAILLGVRADTPGSCTPGGGKSTCTFGDNALASGINYAAAHGAKVINLSIGGPGGPDNVTFQNAMAAAVSAGVVFTISAGNEAAVDPDYPALFATDPRFKGAVLAVGASDASNALASYSNRAGSAAASYVVAPGDNIITGCDHTQCYQASGTSFSAPHVAGAIALLLQGFPNLSGQQAIALLIRTADPLASGASADFGAGLINLQKAFAPAGTLSVPTPQGGLTVVPANTLGASLSPAFGNAVARTAAPSRPGAAAGPLVAAAYDSFHRLFAVDLASAYRMPGRASLQGLVQAQPHAVQQTLAAGPGGRLDFSASAPSASDSPDPLRRYGLWGEAEARADVRLALAAGPLALEAWSGRGGMAPPSLMAGGRDSFAALAAPETALRSSYDRGALAFSVETGEGRRLAPFSQRTAAPSRYSLAGLDWRQGDVTAGLFVGRLSEPQGPLGGGLSPGGFYAFPAETRFASLHGDWRAAAGPLADWRWSAEASLGRTTARGAFLSLASGAYSSSWRLAAVSPCPRPDCMGARISLSQPVRVERGQFSALLPATPKAYFDPLVFTERRIDAAPRGRQIDLTITAFKEIPDLGRLELEALATRQENNLVDAPLNLGLVGVWRSNF